MYRHNGIKIITNSDKSSVVTTYKCIESFKYALYYYSVLSSVPVPDEEYVS